MSSEFVFNNARIKSMEAKLMSAQSVQRLLECKNLDALEHALADMGFSLEEGFEKMFVTEEKKQREFLDEFNVGGALDALILLKFDLVNIKKLLKAKLSSKPYPEIAVEGIFKADELVCAIESDEPDKVLSGFGDPIKFLRKNAEDGKCSPHLIDSLMDKAMYAYCFSRLKKKDKLMREYLVRNVDFVNLDSFLRCKRLALSANFYHEGYIEGGRLKLDDAYGESDEKLKERIKGFELEEEALKTLDSGNIAAFEAACDNALFAYWKDMKNELFEVAPIVAYYMSKVAELKVAKVIVAGVKNGVESELIRERLRDVYA